MQRLYVPSAAESDMRDVLKELNVALGTVVRCVGRPQLRQQIVSAIFRACLQAFEIALLYGGP